MGVLFSPKAGTDRLLTGSTFDVPSNWSAYMWMRKPSTNGGGQLFAIGASSPIDVFYSNSTTDRLHIDRYTSGTTGHWNVTAANDGVSYSATKWIFIAITQSGTSTPTVYTACPADGVALASRTVTTSTSPTGTEDTGTNDIGYIGNYSGSWALGGDMEWFGFHNVVLTLGELSEAMYRGFTLRGAYSIVPMDEGVSALYDLSGVGHSWTNQGASTTADLGAPVTPLYVTKGDLFVPAHPVTTVTGAADVDWTVTFVSDGLYTALGASDSAWAYTFDSDGLYTALGSADGAWAFAIDSDGLYTALGSSDSGWSWTFDVSNSYIGSVGASDSVWSIAFDTTGAYEAFGAADSAWTVTFDSAGILEAILGSADGTWNITFDSDGVFEALGASDSNWNIAFDATGAYEALASADSVWTVTFDSAGILEAITGSADGLWTVTFDSDGVVEVLGAADSTWNFTFYSDGPSLESVIAGDGSFTGDLDFWPISLGASISGTGTITADAFLRAIARRAGYAVAAAGGRTGNSVSAGSGRTASAVTSGDNRDTAVSVE